MIITTSCSLDDSSISANTLKNIFSNIITGEEDGRKRNYSRSSADKTVGLLSSEYTKKDNTKTEDGCTATLIAKNLIITAAHCVMREGKLSERLIFYPSKISNDDNDYSRVFIRKGWISKAYANIKPRYDADEELIIRPQYYKNDIAVLELFHIPGANYIGDELGWQGAFFSETLEQNIPTKMTSYPGDKEDATQWSQECESSARSRNLYFTQCDTYSGASGSALMIYNKKYKQYFVQGIFSVEDPGMNRNYATRFTKETFLDIRDIINGKTDDLKLFKEVSFPTTVYFHVKIRNRCNVNIQLAVNTKDLQGEWNAKGYYTLIPNELWNVAKTRNTIFHYGGASVDGEYSWFGTDRYKDIRGERTGLTRHKISKNNNFGDYVFDIYCDSNSINS